MSKLSLLLATVAALTLTTTERASAQASCPSTDRLQFINTVTGAKVTAATLANKKARIEIGAIPFLGEGINIAFIWLDGGSCTPHWLSYDGTNASFWLTKNTNLCLGSKDDLVDNIVHTHNPFVCAGQTYDPYPMMYNGYRLNIYAGDGNDEVWGDSGTDRIYGGAGNDELHDYGGSNDRMLGETYNDVLECSTGDETICDGGGAPDDIQDLDGYDDTINGGGSSDDISSCGDLAHVDCGTSGAGYSDYDIAHMKPYSTHENCEETVIPSSYCD